MTLPKPSRRQMLVGAAGAVVAGVPGYALGVEPRWLEVVEGDLPVPGLPRALDGFRIAQVTDAHLKEIGYVEERILNAVERVDPQLVVLTGDIVDSVSRLPVLADFCAALARGGRRVVATLGNWEHWGEVPLGDLAGTYAQSGAELLVNDARRIGGVGIVATDDALGGVIRLKDALRRRERAGASLLLTHSPEWLDRVPAAAGRFDLALAGHTHGGQVRLGPLAALPPGSGRFVAGWYDVPTGRAYVSRGTGLSVVPARFTCRPELPIFTLRRA